MSVDYDRFLFKCIKMGKTQEKYDRNPHSHLKTRGLSYFKIKVIIIL